jgi:hypothetical protein
MSLYIAKRFSLDNIGEEWKGCYINLLPVSIKEAIEDLDALVPHKKENNKEDNLRVLAFIKKHFIDGEGVDKVGDSVQKRKLLIDDMDDLPLFILEEIVSFLLQSQTNVAK